MSHRNITLSFLFYITVALSFAVAGETRWTVSPKPLASVPAETQFRTISGAVAKAEPGDTIVIHSGIYREQVVIPESKSGTQERPLRLIAAPTAEVILTGSDLLTDWKAEPELGEYIASTDWPHQFAGPHPNDPEHLWIGRAEQVFVDRYPMRQVFEARQLSQGTFFADLKQKRLYLWDMKNTVPAQVAQLHVEAATRSKVLQVDAAHVCIKGLRFRHCANIAQNGMAEFRGTGVLIEDCVFEYANSLGASFIGKNIIARRCQFLHNGQMGFGAGNAHGLHLEKCLVAENNTKNFSRGWEAGGNKIALSRDVVVDRCVFRDNRGIGMWFDIGNENCEIKNCLFLRNEDHGLFYEIGYTMHAHDNVFVGNGAGPADRSWGHGSGIMISDSMGCVVERNLIISSGGAGLAYRDQRRTTPRLGTPETSQDQNPVHWLPANNSNARRPEYWIWNRENMVRNNIFAYNESSQVHGWFDVLDARHWPRSKQKEMSRQQDQHLISNDPITTPSLAKEGGEPVGRCLENLELRHENNVFARNDGQKLFVWGVPWRKFVEYDNLGKVSEDLPGLERGSQEEQLTFGDYHTLDLRVPSNSQAIKMGCYPQGDIPLVHLGTTEP